MEKHPELFEDDETDLLYNLTFLVGKDRLIEDITIYFKLPECIADMKEIE